MRRIIPVLLNPYSLALWMILLIVVFFPLKIDKYVSITSDNGIYLNNSAVWYDDLDGDGNSERIDIFHNSLGNSAMTVNNDKGVLDQLTFRGKYDFVQRTGLVITGDHNNDTIKEIYVFTLSQDSVLLHIVHDFRSSANPVKNIFITSVGKRDERRDPYILAGEMEDLNNDKSKELIFGVCTGYSLWPRRIFAFDVANESLKISPESNYSFTGIIQDDLNQDGTREIIPYGYAAGNIHDSTVPFPDGNSWLMVLDQELRFIFEPVAFPGEFSQLKPAVIERNGIPVIVALYQPPMKLGDSSVILQFDHLGQVIKKFKFPGNKIDIAKIKDAGGNEKLLLSRFNEGFCVFDGSLDRHSFIPASSGENIVCMDIDSDGNTEIMTFYLHKRQLMILRNDLKHPVTLEFDGSDEKGVLYSVKRTVNRPPQIYVQCGANYQLYDYGLNPHYNYRFFYYSGIYLGILLFILLIRKIQQDQIIRKQENEKRITDLQLQIIRNQLDPHFVMNAINSIITGITDKGKDEARQQLMHFSRLHRSLLLSSDMIRRSLGDELEFTGNYLALEKLRFSDRFDYEIDVGSNVDREVQVPKMIIQIHVENALKHGILPMEGKGILSVTVRQSDAGLLIVVADNGVGRQNAANSKNQSTGRGLKVMEQYTELFNKYHPGAISSSIEDLYDDKDHPNGTRVKISISGNT